MNYIFCFIFVMIMLIMQIYNILLQLEHYRLNEDGSEDVKSIQSKDDQKETEPQVIPLENTVSMTEDHSVSSQPDNGSKEVVALTEQLNQVSFNLRFSFMLTKP